MQFKPFTFRRVKKSILPVTLKMSVPIKKVAMPYLRGQQY